MFTNKFYKWLGLFLCIISIAEFICYIFGVLNPSKFQIGAYMLLVSFVFLDMFLTYRNKILELQYNNIKKENT